MTFKKLQDEHLARIKKKLEEGSVELKKRAQEHDEDKYKNPIVFKAYDEHFVNLKKIPFGTEEYKKYNKENFSEAHRIHAQNRHHYYSPINYIDDVNLFDVIEAAVDISESSKQYTKGSYDIKGSLKYNGIFDYDLEELILNTLKFLDSKEEL